MLKKPFLSHVTSSYNRVINLFMAICLFLNWVRFSWTFIEMQSLLILLPNLSKRIIFWHGLSALELAMLKSISTRLSVLLMFCPPGPEEREKRHWTSLYGITNFLWICRFFIGEFYLHSHFDLFSLKVFIRPLKCT